MSPETFTSDVLALQLLGKTLGFAVCSVPLAVVGGEKVSAARIRNLLAESFSSQPRAPKSLALYRPALSGT